jgi:peptidoglycan/LPS O-acetylase OafA/YrhL
VLLDFAPLVWIGRISYGLYLYHMPVIVLLRPTGPAMALAAAGLTVASALLSFLVIERPCLRLKDRLSKTKPDTLSIPTQTGVTCKAA